MKVSLIPHVLQPNISTYNKYMVYIGSHSEHRDCDQTLIIEPRLLSRGYGRVVGQPNSVCARHWVPQIMGSNPIPATPNVVYQVPCNKACKVHQGLAVPKIPPPPTTDIEPHKITTEMINSIFYTTKDIDAIFKLPAGQLLQQKSNRSRSQFLTSSAGKWLLVRVLLVSKSSRWRVIYVVTVW